MKYIRDNGADGRHKKPSEVLFKAAIAEIDKVCDVVKDSENGFAVVGASLKMYSTYLNSLHGTPQGKRRRAFDDEDEDEDENEGGSQNSDHDQEGGSEEEESEDDESEEDARPQKRAKLSTIKKSKGKQKKKLPSQQRKKLKLIQEFWGDFEELRSSGAFKEGEERLMRLYLRQAAVSALDDKALYKAYRDKIASMIEDHYKMDIGPKNSAKEPSDQSKGSLKSNADRGGSNGGGNAGGGNNGSGSNDGGGNNGSGDEGSGAESGGDSGDEGSGLSDHSDDSKKKATVVKVPE